MVEIDLKGRTGIVTGGASGIGKAVVEKLLQCGAGVVISDINEKQGLAVEEKFKNRYGNCLFVKTDVTRIKNIEEMVIKTKKEYGRIDFLVNNAGILIPRLLVDPAGKEEITEEIFDRITGINQKGTVFCAQAVAREMIKDKIKGVIVNVSSESGLEGSEGQSIYAGTKAAMYSFTRSWAK
ncbi:MAG: SDR family NAD(P)-dependent oxidoreductase, partial [Candidatus Omnitrophica bacterium]|nr:SDR family NAD(P)-dependent oxidoreductase [Candidatus Omnitrophota bacterium]